MKKYLPRLLAFALAALLLTFPGMAETPAVPTLTKAYEVMSADFLGNSRLTSFEGETRGKFGIMGPDGQAITGNDYLRLLQVNGFGYIEAIKEAGANNWGMINGEGATLIPFEFGAFEVINEHWVVAVKLKEATAEKFDYRSYFDSSGTGYYLVEEYALYHMPTGERKASFSREQFDKASAYEGFLIIQDKEGVNTVYDETLQKLGTAKNNYDGYIYEKKDEGYEVRRAGDGQLVLSTPYRVDGYDRDSKSFRIAKDGKQGWMDMQGNLLVSPEYERLTNFMGDHARARLVSNEKEALVDRSGKVIGEFKYDEFLPTFPRGISLPAGGLLMVDGYAAVLLDGKIGYINDKGEETVAPTYPKDAVKHWGNTLMHTDFSGKTILVAADGKVSELSYKSVEPLYRANNGRFFIVTTQDDMVGVIDWHGNELLPPGPYQSAGAYTSIDGGMLLIRNRETRMTEVYTIN